MQAARPKAAASGVPASNLRCGRASAVPARTAPIYAGNASVPILGMAGAHAHRVRANLCVVWCFV
eukprot:scaffold5406_cov129-Isochrysis_galbana.AAC.2